MPRRPHRKSRNGCLECKRRRVKCDERRPICSNCTVSERACEYGSRFPSAALRSPLPAPTTLTPVPGLSPDSLSVPLSEQSVNMLHVELLQNFCTQIRATFDPAGSALWLAEVFSHSITTPYLVNEMLAFSALHMSITHPDRREFYHHHAAQLQTHALSIFKTSNPRVTQETCVPLFLFTVILGFHMLCDTLVYREVEGTFATFLSQFAHSFRLFHGVHAVIGEVWHMIGDTPLGPLFNLGKGLYKFHGSFEPGIANLLDRIIAVNHDDNLIAIYRRALESLQACLDIAEGPDERHARINGATSWPMLLDLEFGDLLEQARPEALVILAHYAVVLHRFRDSWLVGDSGLFVIEQVKEFLGEEWEDWLEWPNEGLRS